METFSVRNSHSNQLHCVMGMVYYIYSFAHLYHTNQCNNPGYCQLNTLTLQASLHIPSIAAIFTSLLSRIFLQVFRWEFNKIGSLVIITHQSVLKIVIIDGRQFGEIVVTLVDVDDFM